MTILVVAEQRQNELKEVTFETISAGRKIASADEKVSVLLMGEGMDSLADAVAAGGADEVIVLDSAALRFYTYDAYRHALLAVIGEL